MSNLRNHLQRDSILFKHICPWGIVCDSPSGRYQFDCRTDDYTFNRILDETEAAGLEFDNECFNRFIAGARGNESLCAESWDRELPGEMILPGEVLWLNSGCDDEIRILKTAGGKYLTVHANDSKRLLLPLATDSAEVFMPGRDIYFDNLGTYDVKWLHFLAPPRFNRAFDYILGRHYNRNTVSDDISALIQLTLRALDRNDFISGFSEISKEYAMNGISSWALRAVTDAFSKKYPRL